MTLTEARDAAHEMIAKHPDMELEISQNYVKALNLVEPPLLPEIFQACVLEFHRRALWAWRMKIR